MKNLRSECVRHNITFCFIETGSVFIKEGRRYYMPKKLLQSEMYRNTKRKFIYDEMEERLELVGLTLEKSCMQVVSNRICRPH